MATMENAKKVSAYQERVYTALCQIPEGKVSSYKALSTALGSSPRAVGGALRNNPFAPEVVFGIVVDPSQPCHRIISSSGFIGGFMGDWKKVPSGLNIRKKRKLLEEEGVRFDDKGKLVDEGAWWDGFVVPKVVGKKC